MQEDLYNPQQGEIPDFLNQVSLALIEENILYQFKEAGWIKVDYVAEFYSSHTYSVEMAETDEELDDVENLWDQFLEFMVEMFRRNLQLGFPNLLDAPTEDQLDLLHFTYRFFILEIKENFVNYVWSYMNDHKDELLENFEIRKDVTSNAYKKELDDDAIVILSNLSNIVFCILEKFLSEEITVDDFMIRCEGEDSRVETVIVSDGFDSFDLTGNFTQKYASMIDDILKTEIEAEIRTKIFKKYRGSKI